MSTASAALHISDIPWGGPIAGMRVARVDGELIALPTFEQSAKADRDARQHLLSEVSALSRGAAADRQIASDRDAALHRRMDSLADALQLLLRAHGLNSEASGV